MAAVEEHFSTETYMAYLRSRKDFPRRDTFEEKGRKLEREWWADAHYRPVTPEQTHRIIDFGERLKEMDEAGIDMQVLSLSFPGVEFFDSPDGTALARTTNDELFASIKRYPDRFAGYAALAPQDPATAAAELERAVKKLGFKGGNINSHIRGEYLDDKKYWVIFEAAENLGVPIYIHPKQPSPDMLKPYLTYPPLASAMWGFAAEVGLHAMRLILSGVFDKYPNLKIILGHMGESLPFWLWRMDRHWSHEGMGPGLVSLRKKPSDYIRENFYMTTSGMFWPPVLYFVCSVLGFDRVLFAVDYPYESSGEAVKFMDSLQITEGDREKIYQLNAESLLGL